MKRIVVLLAILTCAAAYAGWDKNKPADNQTMDLRDDDIRANFAALESMLGLSSGATADANLAPVYNVQAFGADDTGVSDATTEVQAAMDAGYHIHFPPGTYKLDSQITLTRDNWLTGDDAIFLVSHTDYGIYSNGYSLRCDGISFDGNEESTDGIYVVDSRLEVCDCNFYDFYSQTDAIAIRVGNPASIYIDGCTFDDITALTNSTIGDNNGSVRAIQISLSSSECEGVISNCRFLNINTVDGPGGSNVVEDADAIHVSAGSYSPDVKVMHNTFTNVGKRALKLQCNGCEFSHNTVTSSWPTTDGYMSAAVSAPSGATNLRIIGNTIKGTYYSQGIVVSGNTTERTGVVIADNVMDSTYAATLGGASTYGILIYDCNGVVVSNNQLRDQRIGLVYSDCYNMSVTSNAFVKCLNGISNLGGHTGSHIVISDNEFLGRSNASGIGVYCPTDEDNIIMACNSFKTMQDAVYLGNSSATLSPVVGNTFDDIGRYKVTGGHADNIRLGNPGVVNRLNPIEVRNGDTSAGYIDIYEDSDNGAGFTRYSTTTVDLTSAQVKALKATPVELVAAPGSGKVIEFVSAVLILNYADNSAFTESDDNLVIEYDSGGDAACSQTIEMTGFINQSEDMITNALAKINTIDASADIVNKNISLVNNDDEIAGNADGDNTLRVIVTYRVHSGLGL